MTHSPSHRAVVVVSRRPTLRGAVFKAVCEGLSIAAHGDSTTHSGIRRGIDSEGRDSEVGHKVAVVVQSKGIVGIGGDNIAILSPIHKGVTRVGRCSHGAGRTCGVGTTASDGTAVGRVGRHGDGIFGGLAGHLKRGDVWHALLTCDYNHHIARSHRRDRHIDGTRRRHHGHTDDFVVLGDSDIRARYGTHGEISGTGREGGIMADHIGVRNLMERHHGTIAQAMVGFPIILITNTVLITARM